MFYIKLSRIVRSAAPFVVGVAVLLNSAQAEEAPTAKSKPAVYIHITKENDPHDKAVEKAYAKKFTIVEVRDNKQFTSAVLKEDIHPRPELNGRVTVEMIVTSDGHVVEPFVFESSDSRLNNAALDAVRQWRFAPARLNGFPVSETCFAVLGEGKGLGRYATEEQIKKWEIWTPKPIYPESARMQHITGSGMFGLVIDIKSGLVKMVDRVRTTGSQDLDTAAMAALVQWRFKPGVLPSIRQVHPQTKVKPPFSDKYASVRVPVTFSLTHGVRVH